LLDESVLIVAVTDWRRHQFLGIAIVVSKLQQYVAPLNSPGTTLPVARCDVLVGWLSIAKCQAVPVSRLRIMSLAGSYQLVQSAYRRATSFRSVLIAGEGIQRP